MYSQEAIDVISKKIGWSISDQPITLSADNTGTSAKKTNWYHPLVTLDNVIATYPKSEATEAEINEFIRSQMIQTTMVTIESILDNHEGYDSSKDYSDVILSKASLFENAIGYAYAIKMIESFISSPRKNVQERNSKLAYQTLKIEIEGAKNDSGHFVAKGLAYKLQGAIGKAQAIIFPKSITVESGIYW